MIRNEVFMVGQRMMLFAKRFRPKAPSAASLPSGQIVGRQRIGLHSMEFLKTQFLKTSVDMPFDKY
jgi:hypothetical protein